MSAIVRVTANCSDNREVVIAVTGKWNEEAGEQADDTVTVIRNGDEFNFPVESEAEIFTVYEQDRE